jgi:4-carboxymuconolactone decarboxylase
MTQIPPHYQFEKQRHEQFMTAVEVLGKTLKNQGPLEAKTAHLLQLAASVAIHSEGGVHSHVRQAINNGATPDEIHHAIILLTSTVGFPTVSAGLSWAADILGRSTEKARRS